MPKALKWATTKMINLTLSKIRCSPTPNKVILYYSLITITIIIAIVTITITIITTMIPPTRYKLQHQELSTLHPHSQLPLLSSQNACERPPRHHHPLSKPSCHHPWQSQKAAQRWHGEAREQAEEGAAGLPAWCTVAVRDGAVSAGEESFLGGGFKWAVV